VYYVHTDHHGTPRLVTDKANNIRWRWLAEPFGTTAPEDNPSALGVFTQNLRFPGQFADSESGLSYNYFRNYDSTIGRYSSSDPIGLGGGLNTYAYVGGNPVMYADPDGLAQILGRPVDFYEGIRWARKYKLLIDQNISMRERIIKNCPNLLQKFDKWVISIDPNIDAGYLRRAHTFATTIYRAQTSQFNWAFFNREFTDPSAAQIFAHEFRHLMDVNNNLARPGDSARDPKTVPAEIDADAWGSKFWSEQCDCK